MTLYSFPLIVILATNGSFNLAYNQTKRKPTSIVEQVAVK